MESNSSKNRLIQLFYGYGAGKSSIVFGRIIRAVGHDLKPILFQFLKLHSDEPSGYHYGEYITLKDRLGVPIKQYGRKNFILPKTGPMKEDIQRSRKGLADALEVMNSGEYDLVALDEILTAIEVGVLTEEEVLGVLRQKPPNVELMLTGHEAPPQIAALADYVVHLENIKHPFQRGIQAREGFEY